MNQTEIEKYARQLASRAPLFGAMLRRSACRKLSEEASAPTVPHLVKALDATDEPVRTMAEAALRSLKDPGAVDALCAVWAKTRAVKLGCIIAECQYVAAKPVEARVLSALKANRIEVAGENAACVPVLLTAISDKETDIRSRAQTALRSLKHAEAVDALCAEWVKQRSPRIGVIVAECQYVAAKPVEVRVLSALQAKQWKHACENAEELRFLVTVLGDKDTELASRAGQVLGALRDPRAVEILCDLVIADPSSPAARIVRERDYQPKEVSRRCLLFLLTGQIDRYLDFDFELQYVRAEYQAGDAKLKRTIAEVVRRSGDPRLLPILQAAHVRRSGIDKRAGQLTEDEAAVVLEVYARHTRWADIFGLLFHLPLSSVVAALDLLAKSGWQPNDEQDAALLRTLIQCRRGVQEIPKAPPAPEVTLGPVVRQWIDAGRANQFTSNPDGFASASVDDLRLRLRDAPPEAVAALVALSAKGQTTPEDIETARAHPHWPVRLACLALCEVAPEFAFSNAPVTGEGGGMWVGQLAPALLDSAVFRRRALHLNLDQVEALQRALGSSKDKGSARLACGQILCALGAHHLRHTIELEEEMVVRIDETEIEIEG